MNTNDAARLFDNMVAVLRPVIPEEKMLQRAALAVTEEALKFGTIKVNERLDALRDAIPVREADDASALLRQALAGRQAA